MCNISTRIDTLTRQLMVVSKLQRMEERYNTCPHSICNKKSLYNNFDKLCHCAHNVLSLKEQCSRIVCTKECMSHQDGKRRIPCNSRTCKTRRKARLQQSLQLSEAQRDSYNDLRVVDSGNANTENEKLRDKQHKSEQVNLISPFYDMQSEDKIIDTYEEKSEQTVPTKDHVEVNVQSTNINSQEVHNMENLPNKVDRIASNDLGKSYNLIEDICLKDKKIFERIEKDLLNEKERTKDLETKLKSLTCSLNCLKDQSEQRAACLKGALETTEEQTKVAMDLIKKSKDQSDTRELLNKIGLLQQQVDEVLHTNKNLLKERDSLKSKLKSLSEEESKRCEEVEEEVNKMKHAVKEKESVLSKERAEFMDMIAELTNVIDIHKKRISELTGICNGQQLTIHEKDKELSQKDTKIAEMDVALQSSECVIKEMAEKIHQLEYCLCTETKTCSSLKQELDILKENYSSDQRIKEKIIEEQNVTISRQKKLLHDSEKMVQQVAYEFDQLKVELNKEKQKCKSMQVTLDEVDGKLNTTYYSQCEKCRILQADIDYLTREKQKVLAVAKFVYQKLHSTVTQYQSKLIHERQQHRYMLFVIKKKDQEIAYLRNQVCPANRKIT